MCPAQFQFVLIFLHFHNAVPYSEVQKQRL
jgi:hypothetical protein